MKLTSLSIALSLVAIFFSTITSASSLHYETTTFKVYGNCEMCKTRIEKALLKNENIKTAVWDVKTKMLTVSYNPHMISVEEIHQLVADTGNDTEKIKAKDATYKNLHGCCQYDRKK